MPLKAGAGNMIERMAANVAREHIEQITITSDSGTRTLVQKNAGERGKSFFADASAPDTKLETGSAWVDALLRLRALDAAPEVPTVQPKLVIAVRSDDGRERIVKVWEPANDNAIVTSTVFPKGITVLKGAADILLKDKLVAGGSTGEEAAGNARAEAR
jgi:hypothetical protein